MNEAIHPLPHQSFTFMSVIEKNGEALTTATHDTQSTFLLHPEKRSLSGATLCGLPAPGIRHKKKPTGKPANRKFFKNVMLASLRTPK